MKERRSGRKESTVTASLGAVVAICSDIAVVAFHSAGCAAGAGAASDLVTAFMRSSAASFQSGNGAPLPGPPTP
jgi:hypothetical protein